MSQYKNRNTMDKELSLKLTKLTADMLGNLLPIERVDEQIDRVLLQAMREIGLSETARAYDAMPKWYEERNTEKQGDL
jgi:hypothetical protein